ncbi:MAG: DNA-binding protein [Aestuariibacter sp.]|nr:DNA-binding protein [Aestuariibacter sp.]
MNITIRTRDRKVWEDIKAFGERSLRQIAQSIGLSKDSVRRSKKALVNRNSYPESGLWETEEGQAWLCLLVTAVLFEFGLKCNLGADRLSEFFKRIRLEQQIGVSPTALRNLLKRLEALVMSYQHEQESQRCGSRREIIASADETFFGEVMILILMDLSSGYVLIEDQATDRSYETWRGKAQERLQALGLRVRHFVSDRAKALIKLATHGFNCAPGADLFHAQYELSKWLGAGLYRRLGSAVNKLKKAQRAQQCVENRADEHEKAEQLQQAEDQLRQLEQAKQAYSETQQGISESVHAFSLEHRGPQTSAKVEEQLQHHAQMISQLAQAQGIEDNKGRLDKFKNQIKDIASIVDVWWLWATNSLLNEALDEAHQQWLLYTLLPVVYWHQQLQKTQHSALKKRYRRAWQQALALCNAHPLSSSKTVEEIQHWLSWAEWICAKFQRASSSVEGRNGCLSQMYHNGRGLSLQRLKVLTVIHNFDLKRRDDTTAAERLFDTSFPDLFQWLVDHMGELPVPRQTKGRSFPNPLNAKLVAA